MLGLSRNRCIGSYVVAGNYDPDAVLVGCRQVDSTSPISHVTYFRVFDPAHVATRAVTTAAYNDLDPYPDLVVATGHVEQNGAVVLNRT
jgi:hypothetical protein